MVRFAVAFGSLSVFIVREKTLIWLRFWCVANSSSLAVSSAMPQERLNLSCDFFPSIRRIGATFPTAVRG